MVKGKMKEYSKCHRESDLEAQELVTKDHKPGTAERTSKGAGD
jgi:hypothetical protein